MHGINVLTPSNSTLCLIDHQPWVAFPIHSISPEHLTNNVMGLAKAAKALGVPTILSTINGEGGPLRDPLFGGLRALWPDVAPIDRHNTNAWSDPAFVAAVEAAGRKKLVIAGLWTEVCLAQTVISALGAGYEVFFVADASGGLSPEAHDRACQRMIQAGAVPLTGSRRSPNGALTTRLPSTRASTRSRWSTAAASDGRSNTSWRTCRKREGGDERKAPTWRDPLLRARGALRRPDAQMGRGAARR